MPNNPKNYTATECIDVLKTQTTHMEKTLKAARERGAISQEQFDHRMGGMAAAIMKLEDMRALVRGEG